METGDNEENNIASRNGKIHFVLSHSYTVFLFAVVLGVVFDVLIPLKIFSGNDFQYIGIIMIALGSIVVYWAQSTSSSVSKKKEKDENYELRFDNGPYKYLRSPTHFGLFVMTLGLAVVISSPFSVIFTIIAQIVTKVSFLRKEEKLLEEKYGEVYRSYKSKTKNRI